MLDLGGGWVRKIFEGNFFEKGPFCFVLVWVISLDGSCFSVLKTMKI